MKIVFRMKLSVVSLLMGQGRKIERAIRIRGRRGFPILTYHRVVPLDELADGMDHMLCVEPKTFGSHMRFLKRHFRIISLRNATKDGEKVLTSQDGKPGCVLTFDDGWADFYVYAYKVLTEHQIPATLFVPTGYIGSERGLWTIRLSHHLAKILERGVPDLATPSPVHPLALALEMGNGPLKNRVELLAEGIRHLPIKEIDQLLSELSVRWTIPERRIPTREFLSWEEVREISGAGLVEIGSHTQDHLMLRDLSEDEIQHQLNYSKETLIREGVCRPTFLSFCYPNGEHNRRVRRMVKESGYSLATTTDRGWNSRGCDPYSLRRIGIYQTVSENDMLFGCRILGLV